ncbi:uncharacterized protein [Haliotis asinina]|uniref:uncharacterized protein n=1 Tax=Haliotis asinina TaxID=109174 RepID=UPI003531A02F
MLVLIRFKDERKAIQELRKDKGITITAAGKGKATVIMDTPEFTQLVDKTLKDPITYKPLKDDPTAKLGRQLKKTLKTLHTNREISDSIFNHLNPQNSQPPYARATVKIHKNPVKTRILVCSRGSVYYNMAQHLSRILAPLGKTDSSFVKDSASLAQQLRNTSDTKKSYDVSYDVVDIFTNIPIKEEILILSTRLETSLPDLDSQPKASSIS